MKHSTREAAINNTKRFFVNHPTDDEITLQDAFTAWERSPEKTEANMTWFYSKLTNLKYHNLVKPVYGVRNSRRVLDKIELTMEGKKAIGRIDGEIPENGKFKPEVKKDNADISIEDIMKAIPRIKRENPEFEINFDVKPKSI